MKEQIFETLFGSNLRVRILRRFLNYPDKYFSKKELKELLGDSSDSELPKELKNLVKIKFLCKTGKGFRLRRDFPLRQQLEELILPPTKEIFDSLKESFKKLAGIKILVLGGTLFGLEDEPIDVLIVTKNNFQNSKIKKIITSAEIQLGRELNYVVLTLKEFEYRYSMFDKFLRGFFESPHKTVINRVKKFSGRP